MKTVKQQNSNKLTAALASGLILFLAVLALTIPARAATTRTVAIYPSIATPPVGYDATYTSMSAMEAAENGDLVALDRFLRVEIVHSDGNWNTADTTPVTFDGWNTDRAAGQYVEIEVMAFARNPHTDGKWSTSHYRLSALQDTLWIDNDATAGNYFEADFIGLQVESTGGRTALVKDGAYHKVIKFKGCHFRNTNTVTTAEVFQLSDDNVAEIWFINSIFESPNNVDEIVRATSTWLTAGTATAYFYNCTVVGGGLEGLDVAGGTITVKNCAVFNNDNTDISHSGATLDFNATDDDTGGGTNWVDISPGASEPADWNAAVTDYANGDYRVKDASSVLYQAGLSQAADSNVPSEDIAGNARPTGTNPVSIGAFEFLSAATPEVGTTAVGGLVYGEGAVTTPRTRRWLGSTFGNENSAQPAAANITWAVLKASPVADEMILGVYSAGDKNLHVQTWDGSTWTRNWNTLLDYNGDVRAFDIAYERSSGDAIVVFGVKGTTTLKYRKRVGGSWDLTDQTIGGLTLTDEANFVRAESRPTNDDIFVAAMAKSATLYALRWDGTTNSWGDQIQTTSGLITATTEGFDLAFETASGDAFLIWGDDSQNVKYREFTSSWDGADQTAYSLLPDNVYWLVAAYDPLSTSSKIAIGALLKNKTFEFGAWDGSSWVTRPAALSVGDEKQRSIDVAFENNTGEAVYSFSQSASTNQLSWRTWTSAGGFGSVSVEGGTSGGIYFIQLQADPNSTSMLAVYSDLAGDLYHRKWNGSSWSSLEPALETSLSNFNAKEPFMFAWDLFAKNSLALSPIQDTHIQENLATNNFGADATFSLEGETGVRKRPLLLFDLSPIPAGATITAATLTLEKVGGDILGPTADTIDVHALSQSWTEGDSTPASGADWTYFDGNNNWATPGGDYTPAAAASATISVPNGPKEWDVTSLVRDWHQGVQTNYGMLLKRQPETTGAIPLHIFSSREGTTAPKLSVYYRIDPDIVIDCDFSDWTDGDGTEFVIDDEGGNDDYSFDRLDITRFGTASNLSDTFYLLIGYDDLTFPTNRDSSAATLIDTDLDENVNYVFATTVRGSTWEVELYRCDDTISNGCGGAVLQDTYLPGDYCIGTAPGPWGDDTFIEAQLPYSDLGTFAGGDAILVSLVSYNRGFWDNPRDSIFGPPGTQDYDSRIQYDTDTGGGQIIPPVGGTTQNISGTVYGDEGTTPLGAGTTVRLLVNGADGGSDTTNGNGEYFIVASVSSGDAILVYIDNHVTFKGNSATVFGGADLFDLDIYVDHLISRQDFGGTLTNAALAQAKGSSTDDDILYSVSSGNLTVTGTDTELYLPSGHTYAPGGNVTTPNLESRGTFDSNALTTLPVFQTFSFAAQSSNGQSIDGNKPAGTAAGDLLIAIMTTDGPGETLTAPTGWTAITANIGVAHTSRSWYKIAGVSEPATYRFTVGTNEQITLGISRFSGHDTLNPINTSDTNIGSTTTPTAPDVTTTVDDTVILRYYGADDDDYTGDDTGYPGGHTGLYRRQSGGGNGECHQGAAYTTQAVAGPTGTAAFTKDNNEEWSAGTIAIAPGGYPATGTVDINGTLTIAGGSFTAPSGTMNVAGDFVHSGGTFTHNSGTVVLDGTGQTISGSTTFNNLTKSVAATETLTFEAGSTQSFDGTVTLQGADLNLLNLRSSSPGARWLFTVNASAIKSISYVDVQDSNASGSDATKKPIDPTNSVDGGNTVDWFACDEMFSHRRQLTINGNRVSDTGLPADLTDFPVLISLSGDWLKTIAADPVYGQIWHPQGFDILFRAANGLTHLDHEIEHYDGSTGTLVAWVRIPLLSKSGDTNIYIYYGNCGVTDDPQYSTEVWDPKHVAVWHLHDDFLDSTSNPHDGTNSGSVDQPGQIADGQEFPGTSEYIGIADSALINLMNVTTRSFSLWFKADSTSGGKQVIFEEGGGTNGFNIYLDSDTLFCGSWGTAITNQWMSTPFSDTSGWHHIGFTFDGTTGVQKMYLDDVEVDSRAEIGNVPTHTDDINIGRSDGNSVYHDGANASAYYFDGMIDELRISNDYLSKDWMITSFNNGDQPLRDTDCTDTGFICLGGDEFGPVTAVNLLSFKATGQDGSVKVAWETAQEIDNKGFHLYRATSPHGPFIKLTDKLIPGSRLSVKGSSYVYEDAHVTQGKLYYYKLEDNDIHGKSTWHGPICVDWDGDGMADEWEIIHGLNPRSDDSLLDLDGDGLTNLEEYELGTDPLNPDTDGDGIPDGEESRKRDPEEITVGRTLTQGVQIIESDAEGITLELRSDAFAQETVEGEGKLYHRLRITDYIHGFTGEVGKPELPLKGIFIDLPEASSPTLEVVDTEVQSHSDYWVYPVPEKESRGEGNLAHVAEQFAIDGEAYSTNGFYPQPVAELGEIFTFRDQEKLQVRFYPLVFNPVTKELVQHKRIRVRVEYEAAQERFNLGGSCMTAMAKPGDLSAAAWTPQATGTVYKILVADEGIYRLTRTWLEAKGIDVSGIDLSQVRLYNLGQEVAVRVEDGGVVGQFDPGDFIEFYSTPVESQYNKYAKNNVYWLTSSGGPGSPLRMEVIDGTPGSATVAGTHSFTVHHEQDLWYMLSIPGGDSLERWFFYPFVDGAGIEDGGAPVDFSLTLPGVAGQGSVKISMVGYYDADHAVDVSVNGTYAGSFSWSGISFYLATIDGVDLLEGNNTISLTCTSGVDSLAVDWFEVTYPRSFAASNETLKFSQGAGYRYQVTGFSDNDLGVFDITGPAAPQRLINFQVTGSGPYSVEFEPAAAGERSYVVLSSTAMKTPASIIQDSPSSLADPANGADYILITHRELGWDGSGDPLPWLSDLAALRQAQGLRVRVVDVEDIFDEFSYGIFTPQAVKDFLSHAYESWTQPAPQYVLFVGDSTYDAKGNWGWMLADATATYLPTYLTATKYMGETMTDEWFARVSGDDAVPDLYIGRLPAASAPEAAVMVNKIITYENALNDKSWEKNVLLVADNQTEDYEAAFELINEDAASQLPAGMNAPFRGYLDDYLVAGDLTAEIKGKVDAGALVLNYSGHGSTQIWANEHIFDTDGVADLAYVANNEKLPFVVNMSCLTGYFAYPESWGFPSLGEALLRSEGKGAVAALMPTGMTTPEGQHVLDGALFEAIFTEDLRTLGPAISAAKQTLLANGSSDYEEVSETFLLFGDPAMKLKIPLPTRPAGVVVEGGADGVTLSWQEATDCNGNPVAGYNVYRRTSPGGSNEKVNDSLISGTQYLDMPSPITMTAHASTYAEGGATYYYVVTSVDSDGDESVYSEEMSVTIGGGSQDEDLSGGGGGGSCFINTVSGF